MLQKESELDKNQISIKIVRQGSTIPFLSFADDIMIFAKVNKIACTTVKRIIDEYCHISGQKVNFYKSTFQVMEKVSEKKKKQWFIM